MISGIGPRSTSIVCWKIFDAVNLIQERR
jgi:hypothetical protein